MHFEFFARFILMIQACFLRILPQSRICSTAFGPGRKHSLLPALAKNMPPAYFLNASRPPGGSLSHKHILRFSFVCFIIIGKAFLEPRHYGGVFGIQKNRP